MSQSRSRRIAGICSLLLLSAVSGFSQQTAPTLRSTSFYTIKPDRTGDFLSAAKDYAELLKKGGSERSFDVWASLSGDRHYVLVSHHKTWAEFDQSNEPKLKDFAAQLAGVSARIFATVESSHRTFSSLDAELSLPMPTGDVQPMARVIRTVVRPEYVEQYRSLLKKELLPAAAKAQLKLFSISTVRYGGSVFEYSMVTGVDKWADLDAPAPIISAMGEAGYQQFLAKLRPLVSSVEYDMYRLMRDQSYHPTK